MPLKWWQMALGVGSASPSSPTVASCWRKNMFPNTFPAFLASTALLCWKPCGGSCRMPERQLDHIVQIGIDYMLVQIAFNFCMLVAPHRWNLPSLIIRSVTPLMALWWSQLTSLWPLCLTSRRSPRSRRRKRVGRSARDRQSWTQKVLVQRLTSARWRVQHDSS